MSAEGNECKVFLFNNDYNAMCAEVYRHPHIETGGNLFGLWTTSGNVVVHVALGPGKNCNRTDVSFHQDIEYLSRVGRFLNDKFMLCRIGEWHSHHQLRLNRPSSGDMRTIKKHYPQGMKMFLVIIANIVDTDRVVLSPYFFTENGNTYKKGEFEVLEVESPFTTDSTIAEEVKLGAENQPLSDSMQRTTTNNREPAPKDHPNGRVSSQKLNQLNDHQISYDNCRAIRTGSGAVSTVHIPPADYETTNPPLQATGNSSFARARPPGSQTCGHRQCIAGNSSATRSMEIDEHEQPSRLEAILKNLKDAMESMKLCELGTGINIERLASGDIVMKFMHFKKYWLICFPKCFPEIPAKIYNSYSEDYFGLTECSTFKPESLNNHINILLMLKEECGRYSCLPCKKISAQSLTQSDSTFISFLTEEGFTIVNKLCTKIESTIADQGSIEKKITNERYSSYDPTLKVSFKHSLNYWMVEFTSTFPISPAKLYSKNERDYTFSSVYLNGHVYRSDVSTNLDSAHKILLAIAKKCSCNGCINLDTSS